jgi:hypothetical protein
MNKKDARQFTKEHPQPKYCTKACPLPPSSSLSQIIKDQRENVGGYGGVAVPPPLQTIRRGRQLVRGGGGTATQPQPPTFLFIFKFTISTSYISTISTSYITESSTQLRIRAMNINLRYKAKLISNHLTD